MSRNMGNVRMYTVWAILVATIAVSAGIAQGQATDPNTGWGIDCPPGQELDPYRVWRDVDSEEEARRFLIERYRDIGGVSGFALWLRCQDFLVNVGDNETAFGLKPGEKMIAATYLAASGNRRTLWPLTFLFGLGEIQSHYFEITFDKNSNIANIEIHATVK